MPLGNIRNGPEYWDLKWILMYKPNEEVKRVNRDNYGDYLFREPVDYSKLVSQFENLYDIFKSEGVKIDLLNDLFEIVRWRPKMVPPNMMFMRDVMGVLEDEILIGNMRYQGRKIEPIIIQEVLRRMGIFDMHLFQGHQFFEGGDLLYLREDLLMIGFGPRTNFSGAYKIAEKALNRGLDVALVSLPPFRVHLDGSIMPLDEDLVITNKTSIDYYPSLILYSDGEKRVETLYQFLIEEGYDIIEVSDEETKNFGPNVVVIRKDRVLSYSWNKEAIRQMAEAGIDVIEFDGSEFRKAGGGPHCTFNTLLRAK